MRRKSNRTSRRMTPTIAATIKRLHRDTDLPQHEIAALVGVNQGRVNEVINGKRFAEVAPEPASAAVH